MLSAVSAPFLTHHHGDRRHDHDGDAMMRRDASAEEIDHEANLLLDTHSSSSSQLLIGAAYGGTIAPHCRYQKGKSTIEQYIHLVDKLYHKVSAMGPGEKYWVAVAGGPGSGKTTSAIAIAQKLNARCNKNVAVVIPMDGFHYSRDDLTQRYGPDALLRRGAPWTFDAPGIYEKLTTIKEDGCAILPSYSRELSNPVLDGVHVEKHHKIVFVEGLYLLHKRDPDWAPLDELWDERWFVKAPTRDIQKDRLLNRSIKTWSFAKAKQWGAGREGAKKLMEFNDVKNMDLLDYCTEHADEVIVTR